MPVGHSVVCRHMTVNMVYKPRGCVQHICNHCEHLFIIHLFKHSEQLISLPNLNQKLHLLSFRHFSAY